MGQCERTVCRVRMPLVYLTRRETFSASHRLHSSLISDDENKELFGKCNNPAGHGHNYVLEVTVAGQVGDTGMVVNIADIKEVVARRVLDELDHKNLDVDVDYFKKGVVSTTENLAVYIWDLLKDDIESPAKLYEVKIQETEKNSVVYRGE